MRLQRFLPLSSLVLGTAMLAGSAVYAAEVNLTWQEPDRFRDIKAGDVASQKQFQQRVIDQLAMTIRNAANMTLPDDYRLDMTITDVDLAGDVHYFFTRWPGGLRVVDDLYFPSITFTYNLWDGDGNLQAAGVADVRDIGFHYAGSRMVEQAPLGYEKRMINDWFRDTFGDS